MQNRIDFVGMPPEEVVDHARFSQQGLASSAEALEFNKLAFPALESGETHENKVIHTMDADEEDPFTLDSFMELIHAYIDQGKDLILARVVTRKEDTGRLFYSIYNAHTINKVLFRTEPTNGLLHRMKSKNPMNNMDVLGDVHYYVIRTSDPTSNPLALKRKELSDKTLALIDKSSKTLVEKSFDVLSAPPQLECREESETEERVETVEVLLEGRSRPRAASCDDISSIDIKQPTDKPLAVITSPASVTKITIDVEETNNDEPVVFKAFYYGTDDDYLMLHSVREYFKSNAVAPEDIFLFTLYGNTQQPSSNNHSSFVSDPTATHSRVETMDRALARWNREQRRLRGETDSRRSSTSSLERPRSPNATLNNRSSDNPFTSLYRSMFGTPNTPTTQDPLIQQPQQPQTFRQWLSQVFRSRSHDDDQLASAVESGQLDRNEASSNSFWRRNRYTITFSILFALSIVVIAWLYAQGMAPIVAFVICLLFAIAYVARNRT